RRRHTRFSRDWSSDVCSSDLPDDARATEPLVWAAVAGPRPHGAQEDQAPGEENRAWYKPQVPACGIGVPIPLNDAATQVHDYEEDRKSTRLNSSHVKISYAVF